MIGDGSAGSLQQWLLAFVADSFPDSGIEYWSTHENGGEGYRAFSPLPPNLVGAGCYVTQGVSEGRILRVVLVTRTGQTRQLAWAKTFGSEDECWMLARAITRALSSIVDAGELPVASSTPPTIAERNFETWIARVEHALQVEEPLAPEAWRPHFERGLSPDEAIEVDRAADGVSDHG